MTISSGKSQILLPTMKEMFSRLIAEPSVSSVNSEFDMGNKAVVDQLAEWLSDLGFEIELQLITEYPQKYNLIARMGSGDDGLILAGHTDTVPYDDKLWHSDPFDLTEKDDRYYGLGTSDMKGFFPLVLEAIKIFDLDKLSHPLIILATADEESTMNGARALVKENRLRARYAVIGEPTGLQPVRMHKGVMMESITVHGKSGHSSNPAYGNNAMEGMYKVIGDLLAWPDVLQESNREPLFEVEVPTLNLGHIHGGDNPNRICGECELQIDLRLLPGMDVKCLRDTLNQRVANVLADSGLTYDLTSLTDPVPAMLTEETSPIVKAAERFSHRQAGSVAFATEGPFLDLMGIETVVLGAGDIAQAHQPDEFVALDRFVPMIEILRNLIIEFCITGDGKN